MAAKCGAKTRSGKPCKKPGVGAGGRCKFHGGESLSGPAHPNFRHGRHSKYMPSALAERYATAARDPDLTSMRDEIALSDVRIGQLLEALGETGNTRLWKASVIAFNQFKAAGGKKGAVVAARVALKQLEEVLTQGLTAAATWDELRETLELRRRLAESEVKRMKDLHQMITMGQALALLGRMAEATKTHVKDRAALAAINAEYVRLTGGRSIEAPPTG